jgi:uncharacterized membrane protein
MNKNRLEAFSDGVIAIIITIMVLELKVPHSAEWDGLKELLPVFTSYLLSFIFVGIYWGNHHHLLHATTEINGIAMWANLNLLFWLSLIPFATAWMGENHFARNTVILYAVLLVACAVAFTLLQRTISRMHLHNAALQESMQKLARKGFASLAGYIVSIPIAFIHPLLSIAIFIVIALVWLLPDKHIERAIKE